MLLRCLPSCNVKHELFVTKKRKNGERSFGQTDYNEQNQHFTELRSKVGHSDPKWFAKFGCQTRTFCNKKEEINGQPSFGQTDYRESLQ